MADPRALEISDLLARWRNARLPTGVNVFLAGGRAKRIDLSLNLSWSGGRLTAELTPREAMTVAALLVDHAAPLLRRDRNRVREFPVDA